MLFVYDFTVIGVGKRMFPVLQAYLLFDFFDQGIPDGAVAVNIIRSHTGLPAVQIFSEYDSFGRQLQIGGFFYNTGAFSAQFQSDGG